MENEITKLRNDLKYFQDCDRRRQSTGLLLLVISIVGMGVFGAMRADGSFDVLSGLSGVCGGIFLTLLILYGMSK